MSLPPASKEGGGDRPLRIAFLSKDDPLDRKSWSGIPFYMARALGAHCGKIEFVGPIRSPAREIPRKALGRASRILLPKKYRAENSLSLCRAYGRMASRRLAETNCDVVFAPVASQVVAFLDTDLPIVYTSDATFSLMKNYYGRFSDLWDGSLVGGETLERRTIDRANLLLYPSEWAARSAIEDYSAPESKVHEIPYGANLEDPPEAFAKKRGDVCKLFFLGVDWERKGGAIAFEAFQGLLDHGISAQLTVCGCEPPSGVSHPRLKVIPFLNKNDETDRRELDRLLHESSFLLLPTRSECFGIVFCEASAYGLPAVACGTGGVPSAVLEGVNGILLPPEATASEYADRIAETFEDETLYENLCRSSRNHYENRLNWDAWARSVKPLLEELTGGGVRHS